MSPHGGHFLAQHFSIPLGGGQVIEYAGRSVQRSPGELPEPELLWRMPASQAHFLAHTIAQQPMASATDIAIGRTLELAAAAAGDRYARSCTTRPRGVSAARRTAALAVLAVRMPELGPAQRLAVIDGVARWLEEDTSGELSWLLLLTVCGSEAVTSDVYRELLGLTTDGGTGAE